MLKEALPLASWFTVTLPLAILPAYRITLSVLLTTVFPATTTFRVLSAYHGRPPAQLSVHEIVDLLLETDCDALHVTV